MFFNMSLNYKNIQRAHGGGGVQSVLVYCKVCVCGQMWQELASEVLFPK